MKNIDRILTKHTIYALLLAVLAVGLSSCRESKPIQAEEEHIYCYYEPDSPVWTFDRTSANWGTPDFLTFDIEPDYSPLDERLWTDPSQKQYVENTCFEEVVRVVYDGNQVHLTPDHSAGFTAETDGAHVTISTNQPLACVLSGKTDNGSLELVGDNAIRICLNGVELTNQDGPAICSRSVKECFLVTDSASVLRDGSVYAEAVDSLRGKGCVCSKGKLLISGQARLKIVADGANAIHSGKTVFIRRGSDLDIHSHAGSAIKAKNNVKIEGGLINIDQTGAAGHGIAAKKLVQIEGGRTTIISHTGKGKNKKNTRGIKSDSIVAITSGIIRIKESSVGGKAIRAAHLFTAKNCMIDILTSGGDDPTSGSSNRGIQGVDELRIDSCRVRIRCVNGRNEALSSRMKVSVHNSLAELKVNDDAISAGMIRKADIEIHNSVILADAGCDGFDSNGMIHITGASLVVALGHGHSCRGFDCDSYEFLVGPEATVVGIGQITSAPTIKLLSHPACYVMRSHGVQEFTLSTSGQNDNLITVCHPQFRYRDTGYSMLICLPELRRNVSYDFCNSASVRPQHVFHFVKIGGTVSDKTVARTASFMNNYTTYNPDGTADVEPTNLCGRGHRLNSLYKAPADSNAVKAAGDSVAAQPAVETTAAQEADATAVE